MPTRWSWSGPSTTSMVMGPQVEFRPLVSERRRTDGRGTEGEDGGEGDEKAAVHGGSWVRLP